MSSSFHYLVMAEHSMFQKKLLAKLKGTGLTSGQPKLVERRMLGGNRRSFYVFMTDLGKSKLKLVTDAFSELEEEAFRGISTDERAKFIELFQKIYKNAARLYPNGE
ncbi:MAG TPA: hypothetical protein H9758_04020 [Candidatus Mediterraneibacter faecipullorum]|uniref:HTH marR-type domain-containing protein n=1 Tax=Candidatus Mediterraneibacter faecipullorum TaxID=2838670 RepID=A0A9D2NLY4_9FIRM|nr:hypothetical protein [Candidatus Mediterraneibacter faecipullorum]